MKFKLLNAKMYNYFCDEDIDIEIEKILSKKLGNLKQMLNNAAQTQAEIDEQKRQLEWMRGIISRINKLVNY